MKLKVVILPKARIHCEALKISAYAVESVINQIVPKNDYKFYKMWNSKYGKTTVYKGEWARKEKGRICKIYFFTRENERENILKVYVIGISESTSRRKRRKWKKQK
nr:hypothetical protein [Candidatus Freyarchaeota archaeon]